MSHSLVSDLRPVACDCVSAEFSSVVAAWPLRLSLLAAPEETALNYGSDHIGALIVGIGFWGILYRNYNTLIIQAPILYFSRRATASE